MAARNYKEVALAVMVWSLYVVGGLLVGALCAWMLIQFFVMLHVGSPDFHSMLS